jgi:hypothetical protein
MTGSHSADPGHNQGVCVPAALEAAISRAVDHLAAYGDTDIFQSPLDGLALFRNREVAIASVTAHHHHFDALATLDPPEIIRSLVPSGYHSLRLGSQIPPIWNAYYLSLVIACAPDIERLRAPAQSVFSYRFEPSAEAPRLFDPSVGWGGFMEATREKCLRHTYVLVTDIGDFYHRIRIDPLVFALRRAGVADTLVDRLAQLLRLLDVDRFGLPIGGPASRLLAELALARFDDGVRNAGICCLRFVDDLRVFADDEVQAHKHLQAISELAWNEGLSLQKGKTRVMRSRDLLEELDLASSIAVLVGPDVAELTTRPLQSHDPYAELRAQVDQGLVQFASKPDAATRVLREFAKVRLNLSLARNLLAALRFMEASELGPLLVKLLEDCERPAMVPVFMRVLEAIDANLDRLSPAIVSGLRDRLLAFLEGDGAVAGIDLHRALTLRLLCRTPPGQEGCVPEAVRARWRAEASSLVMREALALCAAWEDRTAHRELADGDYVGPWERAIAGMNKDQVRSLCRALEVAREQIATTE